MRAQVTTFLVLGIVILIIIGFAVFVSNFLLETRASEQADLAFKEYEQSVSLNTYVTSCIRASTQQGLWLLGTQGGYIYEDQGGTQAFTGKYIPNVREDLRGLTDTYQMAVWLDEDNNLLIPKLCSNTGPNRRGVSTEAPGCILPTIYGVEGDNIQDSLSTFINNSLPGCLNLDAFTTRKGSEIIAGEPQTEIVFDPQHFIVKVNYPFEINIRGKDPETKQANYTYKENSRLQQMYVIAYLGLTKSVNDPDFILWEDYLDLNYYTDGILLVVQEDYASTVDALCQPVGSGPIYCDDSRVIITDDYSKLAGDKYEFMFGIER